MSQLQCVVINVLKTWNFTYHTQPHSIYVPQTLLIIIFNDQGSKIEANSKCPVNLSVFQPGSYISYKCSRV